jgi:hypothetical protein
MMQEVLALVDQDAALGFLQKTKNLGFGVALLLYVRPLA